MPPSTALPPPLPSNGLGNCLTVKPNSQPLSALKISSRPMVTPTAARLRACAMRRSSSRSSASPIANDTSTVATNATQYGHPAWISVSAM